MIKVKYSYINCPRFWIFTISIIVAGICYSAQAQQTLSNTQSPAPVFRAFLDSYCVACHNELLKTAGLMLDKVNVADVSQDPELWERVAMKLSLRAMPPVGMPRPGNNDYETFRAYLHAELDHAYIRNSNPGKVLTRRLNRTEYQNAIRDLLDIEIDSSVLLPPDNSSEGFDNNADVLVVSPLLVEQYMIAAGKISRLAVGTSSLSPGSDTYAVSSTYTQDARMSEDLPFGSRGGTAIRHYFPKEGEYTISIRLHRTPQGYIRGLRKSHRLDIRLNHESIGVLLVGGKSFGRSGPLFTNAQNVYFAGDEEQKAYESTADDALVLRFSAPAGSSLVGVAFLDESTKPTGILTPQMLLSDRYEYKGGNPAVASVSITGPYGVSTSPKETASHKKVFVCHPAPMESPEEKESCAKTILSNLARQAYRRPVTSEDIEELLKIYSAAFNQGGFETGIEVALQGILAGPKFLFRVEQEPEGLGEGSIHPVSDVDLASRLSFFLWSSIPDEELLALAEAGNLRKPGVLKQQVQRLMSNPRSEAFISNFGGQWLAVRKAGLSEPQLDMFPEYDDELRDAFKQETKLWFESMVREDKSVVDVLTSDYTYVNSRLARHYGIPDIYGNRFRQIKLEANPERRGLLGKAAFLTASSFNNRTSPVLRGKWVLDNLLSMPPPPPPADVPGLEVVSAGGRALTLKEALESHRANPVCNDCHKMMEPIGLALEGFDAIGSFRSVYTDSNSTVDTSGILFDGSQFQNMEEFQEQILKYSDRFVHTVTEKLLSYAIGRGITYNDQSTVREIVKKAASENYSWSSLIQEIVESVPFQYRAVAK